MPSRLTEYRASPAEQQRISDLFALFPTIGASALDIGARDCYLARKLAKRFDRVVALDLEKPDVKHPGIEPVAGNVTGLPFDDKQVRCGPLCRNSGTHSSASLGEGLQRNCQGRQEQGRDRRPLPAGSPLRPHHLPVLWQEQSAVGARQQFRRKASPVAVQYPCLGEGQLRRHKQGVDQLAVRWPSELCRQPIWHLAAR